MKCTSHIVKEYKRTKADSTYPYCRPSGEWIENPDAQQYPVCGGDVTVKIQAIDEPYHGGHSASLEVEETCTRCKYPFYPSKAFVTDGVTAYGGFNITSLLEGKDSNDISTV